MNEIAADPSVGVAAATKAVPDLAKDPSTQLAILTATIAAWRPAGATAGGPITGSIESPGWTKTIAAMDSMGLVAKPVTLADLVDTSFAAPTGS